jgi:glycosyltransferase involved in cell wall biosynthesis
MRILHCLRAPVGGLFRHVLDLAAEQAARGHDVGILADSTARNALTDRLFAGIAPHLTLGVVQLPMSRQPGLGDIKAVRSVTQIARPLGLDVLHGHGAKGGAYARLARRALRKDGQNVKAFYTPHGGTLNFRPGTTQGRLFMRIEQLLERYTDGLIFESAYAARIYRERLGPGPAPERVIPNGLRPGDFFEVQHDANRARDILFVGELRDLKGVDVLLGALANLAREGAPRSATIVGSGPAEAELKAQARELGLEAHVLFTGALPARDAFALGRVMTVPSRAESFPYIVLEAAAAGLPLITTRVGGIPEIVAGTDTALIAAGDVIALTEAIRAVFADLDGAHARAARLKQNVGAKFTVAGMTDAVLDFYALTAA